jgi:hypothetical protein
VTRRPAPTKRGDETYTWHTCACGKKGYLSRKAAKNRAKAYHPDDPGLAPYRCPLNEDYWHYGHLGVEGRDFYRDPAPSGGVLSTPTTEPGARTEIN